MEMLPLVMPGSDKIINARKHFIDYREVPFTLAFISSFKFLIFPLVAAQETANRAEAIAALPKRKAPFILSLGPAMHLVMESKVFCRLDPRCSEALLTLMAAYYVFDLQYSPNVRPSLLFIQSHCLERCDDHYRNNRTIGVFSNIIFTNDDHIWPASSANASGGSSAGTSSAGTSPGSSC